jgi:hypothetical protein
MEANQAGGSHRAVNEGPLFTKNTADPGNVPGIDMNKKIY